MNYKLTKDILDPSKEGSDIIIKDSNPRVHIPKDPDNVDYQEYLEWLKIDGNVPEEAD